MRYSLYFGYGSNLNPRQFAERCPRSRAIIPAVLPNHRFIIMDRGYASFVKRHGCEVRGVLFALTEYDEINLDFHEGVYSGIYRRAIVEVVTLYGANVEALTYVGNETEEGSPMEGYLERCIKGMLFHNLPPKYIAKVRAWATKHGKARSNSLWRGFKRG